MLVKAQRAPKIQDAGDPRLLRIQPLRLILLSPGRLVNSIPVFAPDRGTAHRFRCRRGGDRS